MLPSGSSTGTLIPWLSASALYFFLNSFVTRKGRQLCADPKAFWVQKLLELLPEH